MPRKRDRARKREARLIKYNENVRRANLNVGTMFLRAF